MPEPNPAPDNTNVAAKNHAEFFDLIPGMVVVMDSDHTIIDMNREAARVLGRTRQECAGHKLWEYLDNPDCRANKCAAARAVATGKKQEGIVRSHGGADEGAMLVSAAPRFGRDGAVTGVVQMAMPATFLGLTDEVERVTASVSHGDLNTRIDEGKFDGQYRDYAKNHRAEEGPEEETGAADDHHHQDIERQRQVERHRINILRQRRIERAGEPTERRADRERHQGVAAGIDAEQRQRADRICAAPGRHGPRASGSATRPPA